MTLCTPYSRVARRTIFDVSLYRRAESTIAGVETRGMLGNVALSITPGMLHGGVVRGLGAGYGHARKERL